MTKTELNQAITNKTNLNLTEVSSITECLFSVIKYEVIQGNKITFKGFGSFLQKKRSAKKVQLIKEKRTIALSEHYIPNFLPSKSLKKNME
jgi:DNA-binding protein HU-beta